MPMPSSPHLISQYVGEDELVEVTPKNIRIRKNPNIKPKKK